MPRFLGPVQYRLEVRCNGIVVEGRFKVMHGNGCVRAAPHCFAPPDMAGRPWLQLSCCCKVAGSWCWM